MVTEEQTAARNVGPKAGPARATLPRAEIDAAVVLLIARHGAKIKRSALRYSICPEDADDAYQRSLEILIKKAPTTKEGELIRWLHTVVKHEALAIRRQRERTVHTNEMDDSLLPGEWRTPEDCATAAERVGRASEAIRQLKPHEMRCLVMKASGYSYNEIAERNGWTWTKVNRCMSEGRASFLRFYESIEVGERCTLLEPLISSLADGEIADEDAETVRRHLRGCPACRTRLREYRSIPARVAGILPPVVFGLPLADGVDRSAAKAADLATQNTHDGFLASAYDLVAAAFRAVRDAVRTLVAHGLDTILGRTIAPFSVDPSGISTTAKVCTGAACVLIAGGAATAGIQKGRADKQRTASNAPSGGEAGGVSLEPPLTGGPAPLPSPTAASLQPAQPNPPAGGGNDASEPESPGREAGLPQGKPAASTFEPDDAGAPASSQPGGEQSIGSGSAPKTSHKPPIGGAQEFQP